MTILMWSSYKDKSVESCIDPNLDIVFPNGAIKPLNVSSHL
ncbi:23204_t:CDS:2 [Rhizophagus irregularis]|nr:23204_t:CDS:2 [Rhizophagus irregularis]